MRTRIMWLLAVALLLCPARVSAQQPTEDRAEVAPGQAGANALARRAFEDGTRAYQAGDYESALRLFEASYALTEAAELLYNLAVVNERLGRSAEALHAYENYLTSLTDAAERSEVQGRIERLRQTMAAQYQSQTPTAVAEPEPIEAEPIEAEPIEAEPIEAEPEVNEPSESGTSALPWVLVGGGVALMLGGAAALGLTLVDMDAVKNGERYSEIRDAQARVPWVSGIGFTLAGVGLAAIGTGLLYWVLESSADADSDSSLTFSIGPTGVQAWGQF